MNYFESKEYIFSVNFPWVSSLKGNNIFLPLAALMTDSFLKIYSTLIKQGLLNFLIANKGYLHLA